MLVIDSRTILKDDERAVEEQLRSQNPARRRHGRLKVRFPVISSLPTPTRSRVLRIVLASKNEDKQLVWGATIPTRKAKTLRRCLTAIQILQNAIMKRRLVRLSAPFRRFDSFVFSTFRCISVRHVVIRRVCKCSFRRTRLAKIRFTRLLF